MWYRKEGDEKRRERLIDCDGYPSPWYYDEAKGRWVRLYRGRGYTTLKRLARRKIRRMTKRTGVYSRKYSDLWRDWI